VLEVETPALSAAGTTDPLLATFTAGADGPEVVRYLHTSPEFPMKRLLAAGSGPIYQICKVFRRGESGRRHNPEFTLLEWYRPGWDARALMGEVDQLVRTALEGSRPLGPSESLTYAEAFEHHLNVDPHSADVRSLRRLAEEGGVAPAGGLSETDPQPWLDLLLATRIEPHLGRSGPTFLTEYPAAQAALARVKHRPDGVAVAERFELYIDGVELANGFQELTDAAEQRQRFEEERRVRQAEGLPDVPADERLLAALEQGLPECAGVALGVDRLVALAAGAASIDEVLAFPFDRA
jgi:lysyl-tRNA synthetase class 2